MLGLLGGEAEFRPAVVTGWPLPGLASPDEMARAWTRLRTKGHALSRDGERRSMVIQSESKELHGSGQAGRNFSAGDYITRSFSCMTGDLRGPAPQPTSRSALGAAVRDSRRATSARLSRSHAGRATMLRRRNRCAAARQPGLPDHARAAHPRSPDAGFAQLLPVLLATRASRLVVDMIVMTRNRLAVRCPNIVMGGLGDGLVEGHCGQPRPALLPSRTAPGQQRLQALERLPDALDVRIRGAPAASTAAPHSSTPRTPTDVRCPVLAQHVLPVVGGETGIEAVGITGALWRLCSRP